MVNDLLVEFQKSFSTLEKKKNAAMGFGRATIWVLIMTSW